jgi:hypothetical protein
MSSSCILRSLGSFLLIALLVSCSGNSHRRKAVSLAVHRPISLADQFMVLLDVNPNQKDVLRSQLTLVAGVIQTLDGPGNKFSVITFGAGSAGLLQSKVRGEVAIAAVREIGVAAAAKNHDDLSGQLYDALSYAIDQFSAGANGGSILIITEGNDYPRGKILKHTILRAEKLQVSCSVAMIASHRFYAPKAIQYYGFYLRRLAGKTQGRYIEIEDRRKNLSSAIDRLSWSMMSRHRFARY